MSSECIGTVIQKLRKEKKITQETLAAAIGVSAQAVSKWEVGGTPDIALLPDIADFFDISIDKLFSRDARYYDNIETVLAEYINSLDESEIHEKWFQLFWTIQRATCGIDITKNMSMELENINADMESTENIEIEKERLCGAHSVISENGNISSLSLSKNQQYAFLMPKSENSGTVILPIEEYRQLFAALSDSDYLNALFFFYRRDDGKKFTDKLLTDKLNLSEEKAREILALFSKYEMIVSEELEIDDSQQITMYFFNKRYSFIPFLIFAKELIQRPRFFYASKWSDHGML